MKFYQPENVFDAALRRVRWLFDEFEHVMVDISGGKDSTVCLNLALRVAEEKGRLPLEVLFLDQEAEWQTVIDHIRLVMADPRVTPVWLQVPIKLFNATSTTDPWLNCWEPGKQWIRDKEPNSFHDNVFGTDRFQPMFAEAHRVFAKGRRSVHIAGVRAEESPARLKGLTAYETYKGETWGKCESPEREQFVFYPLYDWSYTDVWKAIHANGWPYCRIYDYFYQHGVPVPRMRVSNVHHETAVHTLLFLQEIEGETWDRITARLSGINTVGQMQEKYFTPAELPPMFGSWFEYRDHLIDNLVPDEATRAYFRKTFAAYDDRYLPAAIPDLVKTEIACVLINDYHGTKLSTFRASHALFSKGAGTKGGKLTAAMAASLAAS